MSGVSLYHHKLGGTIFILLTSLLKKDWEVYYEGFKVKTPDGNFFYPDVLVFSKNAKKYFTDDMFYSLKFYLKRHASLI